MGEQNVFGDVAIKSDPYRALCSILQRCNKEVLEIETLGLEVPLPDGHSILEDGACIGIPKMPLVKAFLEARGVFTRRHSSNIDIQVMLEATQIILLFDPEHLTAANFRKQSLLESQSTTHQSEVLAVDVQFELNFLDSILTSPLHRQSKSPTLWFHRFWVVSNFVLPASYNHAGSPEVAINNLVRDEVVAVFKSAQRHAHNYYAWLYLRRLTTLCLTRLSGPNARTMLRNVSDRTLEWTLQHPSDASGWSFLSCILRKGDLAADRTKTILDEVSKFVDAVQWKGEAISAFMREAEEGRRRALAVDI